MRVLSMVPRRPVTLALSPQAGRGDDRRFGFFPSKLLAVEESRHESLLPARGEKVPDRPDEGLNPPSSARVKGGAIHVPHP